MVLTYEGLCIFTCDVRRWPGTQQELVYLYDSLGERIGALDCVREDQ